MDISTNHALTAVSYGAVGCVGAMFAANAVLAGAGASAKVGAYVADYFKSESVAQNLRIKGDQLISLAGKYVATELKLAAALIAVGGSAALVESLVRNSASATASVGQVVEETDLVTRKTDQAIKKGVSADIENEDRTLGLSLTDTEKPYVILVSILAVVFPIIAAKAKDVVDEISDLFIL